MLGKKSGLPEPVCFSESFYYWFPRNPSREITELIYINGELGDDIHRLFADCRLIGQVQDTLAREYGTGVWLCKNPGSSFNEFWKHRIPQVTNQSADKPNLGSGHAGRFVKTVMFVANVTGYDPCEFVFRS